MAAGVTKFLILFKQYNDLEIFAHKLVMCASNDRYSSKSTPSILKHFSSPSEWILLIGTIIVIDSNKVTKTSFYASVTVAM
jgi:hypothetical protein